MSDLATGLWLVFALSALLFWWVVRHQPRPIIQPHLFTIPRFILANIGTLIICVGMFSVMFFVPLFLQYQQGYDTLAAASAILPVTVAAFIFGLFGLSAGYFAIALLVGMRLVRKPGDPSCASCGRLDGKETPG